MKQLIYKLKLRGAGTGFTMIELLVVIAVIAILAVAVLSAINPVEQIRKGRDTGRKSDSAELLSALERYLTTFDCYPWEYDPAGPTRCSGTALAAGGVNADFTSGGDHEPLLDTNELKSQFATRSTLTDLFVSEDTNGQVSVCFEPESATGREGGFGPTFDVLNATAATCTGSYVGEDNTASCFVCVPQ